MSSAPLASSRSVPPVREGAVAPQLDQWRYG